MCCHKDCPRCGGYRCGQQSDSSGKKLGRGKCCGYAIRKRDNVCGEHPAPCKMNLGSNETDFEKFMGLDQNEM